MSAKSEKSDILVVGAGLTGLISALFLSDAGFHVRLIGPLVERKDDLTTALMIPALNMFKKMQISEHITGKMVPLQAVRIIDGTHGLIRSPIVTFYAREIGERYFGLNIPNQELGMALRNAVEKRLEWIKDEAQECYLKTECAIVKTSRGSFSARLAVAADGRNSKLRSAAGLSMKVHFCEQIALTCSFEHTKSHDFTSTEFHTGSGPFTQIPLSGKRSALVWVTSPENAERLNSLDTNSFSIQIERKMQSMLGQVKAAESRSLYPVFKGIASRFAQNRVALVGESAHILPPIAAQGLNLGIRDIQDLALTIKENPHDPGSPEALAKYHKKRRVDVRICYNAINFLNHLLTSNQLPAQILRSGGSFLLNNIPALRTLLMREGTEPGYLKKSFQRL